MHGKPDKQTDVTRKQKRERFGADEKAVHQDRRRRWLVWGVLGAVIVAAGVAGGLQLLPEERGLADDGGIAAEPGAEPLAPPLAAGPANLPASEGEARDASQVAAVAATRGHAVYPQVVENGEGDEAVIRVAIADLEGGAVQHYTYMYGQQPIEFFLLESQDGVLRAAFNACDVCYGAKKGYVQSRDVMVCVNCGRRFASNRINVVQGGCNPAPLNRRIEGEYLVIDVVDIVRGYRFF